MEIVSYARVPRTDEPQTGSGVSSDGPDGGASRVAWVDIAKGICIILVVMMHSTLGVEAVLERQGFMQWAVAFAKPFRLPDFFLVSGLFLARVIDRDWRSYADKRVIHFVYFYLLWLVIQSTIKFGQISDGGDGELFLSHMAWSLIEPFSTLWFVYALAVFSIVTKLLRPLPSFVVLGLAALLQVLPIHTSSDFVNELCERWVYFVAGYLFAPRIFMLASWAAGHAGKAALGLLAWALANGALALIPVAVLGVATLAELPGFGLIAGAAGALAVTVAASLLAGTRLGVPLRYIGSKSLAVYLTFFLPMAFARLLMTYIWPQGDAGVISIVVLCAAVVFPLVVEWLVRGTRFSFLYVRPRWAHLQARTVPQNVEPERAAPKVEVTRIENVEILEPVGSGIDLGRALNRHRDWHSTHSPSTSTARDPGLNPDAAAVSHTPRATASEATSSTLPHVVQTRKIVAK